jgi:ketosteroid isomerase-like protein
MLALAVAVALALAGCESSQKHEDPAEVRASIDSSNKQFMDAFSRRDAAAIGLLYAEDGQVLPPGAPPLEGREAIATMWQSVLALPIGAWQRQTVDLGTGQETAWEAGRYTTLDNGGRPTEMGKYVVIWKHDEAGWKIYRDIWNSNSPAAAPAAGENPAAR